MTEVQLRILEVLARADGPAYGTDLVREGVACFGSVYVHLAALEEIGWVEAWEEPPQHPEVGLPRRAYRITSVGAAQLLPAATAKFRASDSDKKDPT